MIALLVDDRYFYDDQTNTRDFLISYAKFIGFDIKVFTILANSGEMSVKELVEYINNRCYASEEIVEIYEIGKKVY